MACNAVLEEKEEDLAARTPGLAGALLVAVAAAVAAASVAAAADASLRRTINGEEGCA